MINDIGYGYDEAYLLRSAVKRNVWNWEDCHKVCISTPGCFAWHLRLSTDQVCVPVAHYKSIVKGAGQVGWVSGRRNTCTGIPIAKNENYWEHNLYFPDKTENFVWAVKVNPDIADTTVKMQVAHKDFVDENGDTQWFNLDDSSIADNPDGIEVSGNKIEDGGQYNTYIITKRLN